MSRVLCLARGEAPRGVRHLSGMDITAHLYRSTLQRGYCARLAPHALGRAALVTLVYANFHLPMCTARLSPAAWWALTPPSHPYL